MATTLDRKFPAGGLEKGYTVIPNSFIDYAGDLEITSSLLQFYITIKRFHHMQVISDKDIQKKTGWSLTKIYTIRKEWESNGCEVTRLFKKNKAGHLYCIGSKYNFSEAEANLEEHQEKESKIIEKNN